MFYSILVRANQTWKPKGLRTLFKSDFPLSSKNTCKISKKYFFQILIQRLFIFRTPSMWEFTLSEYFIIWLWEFNASQFKLISCSLKLISCSLKFISCNLKLISCNSKFISCNLKFILRNPKFISRNSKSISGNLKFISRNSKFSSLFQFFSFWSLFLLSNILLSLVCKLLVLFRFHCHAQKGR